MAKRTPRSEAEADDTTSAASTNREPRPSGSSRSAEGRQPTSGGRSRTSRDANTATTEEQAPQESDTFAGRAEPNEAQGAGDAPSGDTAQTDFGPTEDEIRYRAYLLYVERGGEAGTDFEDWLQAERELKNRNR